MSARARWWVATALASVVSGQQAATRSGEFVEPDAPFVRSALLAGDRDDPDRARRGVLVRCGHGVWACFDPDLLRWSAIWRTTPDDGAPLTLAGMAAVSYPDKKAKAKAVPQLVGERLSHIAEVPGATAAAQPADDPRHARLADGKTPVGPLPPAFGRFDGVELCGERTVVRYTISGVTVREGVHAVDADRLERTIEVAAHERPLSLRLAAGHGEVDGAQVRVGGALWPCITVAGVGATLRSDATHGTWLVLHPGAARTVHVVIGAGCHAPGDRPLAAAGGARFPPRGAVTVTAADEGQRQGPLLVRDLPLPDAAATGRFVRPTDLAFLRNGTALVCTLDGDVWRVDDLEQRQASWRRVAAGLFEPTNLEIDADDRVYVLGRDQVTELVDVDGDGTFDRYDNAADGFWQTLNTRDYAMSMVLEPDGSFLVAKGGIDDPSGRYPENDAHRGAILRVHRSGEVEVLADGLRLPYVGRRDDGAVFASDQQGNWIPSTPVHRIADDRPSYGFVPTRHRGGDTVAAPLLWFPYQSNRSGAGFVTLDARAFPDLVDRFVHVAWDGRLFVLATPADGRAFGWRLPLQFSFPSLNGQRHPRTGTLYAIGLGISGYLPMTARFEGLAAVRQADPLVVPTHFQLAPQQVAITFAQPVAATTTVTVASLRYWDVRRSSAYGSGHYRWDGKPGEHTITPSAVTWSPDRTRLELTVPNAFRSSIAALHLQVQPTGGDDYPLELFTTPSHLPQPDPAQLATLDAGPQVQLRPGNPRKGKELFTRYACAGCHSLQGDKLVGPPLNGVASRHRDDPDAFLRESILSPGKVIAQGYPASMPSFEGVVTPQDVEHLVAYLKGLR